MSIRETRAWRQGTFVLAAGLLFVAAPEAWAQSPVSVQLRGGIVFPVGDLAKITNTGYDLGLGFAYRLSPRWHLRAEMDVVQHPGAENAAGGTPRDITIWYLLIGAEWSVLDRASPWELLVGAGVGLSEVDSDPLPPPGRPPRLDETVPASSGVLEARYRVSESFSVNARARILVAFMGSRLSFLQGLDPSIGDSGALVSVPLEAGVRFSF